MIAAGAATALAAFVLDVDARARGRGTPIRSDITELADLVRVRATEARLQSMSAHGHNASRGPADPSPWMTSSAVAEAAGCSPRTVVRAIQRGELPATRQGRDHQIDAADAARWLLERNR